MSWSFGSYFDSDFDSRFGPHFGSNLDLMIEIETRLDPKTTEAAAPMKPGALAS